MHTIRSIEIQGFRGQAKPIKLALDRHANFIIGRNGTGKTTLINLINAAMAKDTNVLRRTAFKSIIIKLNEEGSRRTPAISIHKDMPSNSGSILYDIQETSRSTADRYIAFRIASRRVRLASGQIVTTKYGGSVEEPTGSRELKVRLESLYRLTWLSLQRRSEREEFEDIEIEEYNSDVDNRLSQVFTDLIRYFSRLDGRVADQTLEFQKQWFLSFLSSNIAVSPHLLGGLDTEQEKSALATIFHRFDMKPETYNQQLDNHFSKVAQLKKSFKGHYNDIGEIAIVIDTFRLHSLVEKWEALQKAQKNIYGPKTDFIKISSDMLYKKRLEVNRSNQSVVISDEGSQIPIESLSSGEKQLLIFLSETLLQERESHIFLADEPELSLHVEWQEDLVPSLLGINPSAQVIFATHSPDIVGRFQSNVIEMEKITA